VAITIAIANQKGGVGKTTTAINVAAALALDAKRTLLVDIDPQGNTTNGVGVDKASLATSLYHALDGSRLIGEVVCATELTDLLLVPATKDLVGAEIELVAADRREFRLKDALASVTAHYDYVLLDCPPSLGILTQNGIVASSQLLIPTEPKYYAFAGIDTLNKMVISLAKGLRFKIELLGVLITMYERGTRLHQLIAQDIRDLFGDKAFQTVIYKNVRLSESEQAGMPIILFDRRASGSQNYEALADEVLGRVPESLQQTTLSV